MSNMGNSNPKIIMAALAAALVIGGGGYFALGKMLGKTATDTPPRIETSAKRESPAKESGGAATVSGQNAGNTANTAGTPAATSRETAAPTARTSGPALTHEEFLARYQAISKRYTDTIFSIYGKYVERNDKYCDEYEEAAT